MVAPDIAQSLAEALVERATAAGASAADSIYIGDRSRSVEVRKGALEDVRSSDGETIGLRLFLGQQSATVAASDLSQEGMATLVERCIAMAREAPPDPYAGLAPRAHLANVPLPDIDCDDGRDPDPASLKARALECEASALSVSGVTNSNGASASASAVTVALATSSGFSAAYRSSAYGCSAGVIAGEGSAMQRDHAWHSARHLEDLDDPAMIGRKAGERAVARRNPGKPKPGRYPVLFDPRVSGSLLGHFASAINGASVARGTSFLQDQLGEPVFAAGITLTDDPLRPRGLRSRAFDGEGVAVARRAIVEGGILKQWIAESASARQLGIAPTGHAARGAGGAPSASPSNFYLEPGERSREQLLALHAEALLVIELIGQGVNGVTGDYSRGAVGFVVREGAICEPVSEITIAGNLIEMFATLEAASDLELRQGIDAPTVLVPEMTVASA